MMLKVLWFAAVVVPALALPQASLSVSESEERLLTENHLVQLFASGDVAVDLKTLIPNAKISVPDRMFFNRANVVVPSAGASVGSIQTILTAGLQSCKTCGDGQFTSTACTLTSDTVCTNCRQKRDNEYEVSACVRGDANTVGADAQATVCSAPVAGTSYVKTACGQKNTVISTCSAPSDQQYIRADCIPGDIKTPGTDTDIGNCNKPSGNQWVKKTCDAKSDATIADCSSPQSGFYIQTACVQGTIRQQGSDTGIQPCTAPGTKQYTTQACSRDRDTQINTCDEPAQGFFTTKPCKPGSANGVGQNTKTQACQTPGPDKYFTKTCGSGSWSTVGSDAQLASCSNPEPGFFTSSLCKSTQNTQFTACSKRQANSYITSDCVAGSYNNLGSDLAQVSCSGPSDGFFVSGICTDTQNTATTKCKTAGQGQYIEPSGVCVPGSAYVKGSDAVVKDCSSSGSGSYIKTGCTATSNAAVVSCDGPATGFFTSTVCSATSNTLTTACKTAGTGQFVATACNPGTATSLGSDAVVKSCDGPAAGYFTSAVCSANSNTGTTACKTAGTGQFTFTACNPGTATSLGSDAVIKSCSTPGSGSYIKTPCSSTSDSTVVTCDGPAAGYFTSTVCSTNSNTATTACKTAGTGQFVATACNPGTAISLGSDTVVKDCRKVPDAGYYIKSGCTSTSDAVQELCSTATTGQYVSTACTSTSNAVLTPCATCAAYERVLSACTATTNTVCGCDATTDVAQSKTTTQSSTGFGGLSSFAVSPTATNGGNYWNDKCTHTNNYGQEWWGVDLGSNIQLVSVTVVNRVDCCSERLDNAEVFFSSTFDPTGQVVCRVGVITTNMRVQGNVITLSTTCTGRYLIIRGASGQYLTLCKVSAKPKCAAGTAESQSATCNGDKDIAVNKPTAQSSVGFGGNSYFAVLPTATNGGDYFRDKCTHTNQDNPSWWALDLETSTAVAEVVIVNRVDCCSERIDGAEVAFTSELGGGQVTCVVGIISGAIRSQSNIIRLSSTCTGRYLRIKAVPSQYLTLCKVSVKARCPNNPLPAAAVCDPNGNVALNKPTYQSSTGWGGESYFAVLPTATNGGDYWRDKCTHTNEPQGWWAVDLVQDTAISQVTIVNRVDCCSERIDGARVWFSSTPSPDGSVVCNVGTVTSAQRSSSNIISLSTACTGRYLIIKAAAGQYLTLCKVSVKPKCY